MKRNNEIVYKRMPRRLKAGIYQYIFQIEIAKIVITFTSENPVSSDIKWEERI